jgi:hypothetical protein
MRTRQIFPIGPCVSVLVVLTFAGCPGTAQVDTSQRILLETGEALSHVDRINAALIERQAEGAIARATARVHAGECLESESEGDCVVRFVREELETYYRLTAALEATNGTLRTWEQANDGWRDTGEQPADWNQRICVPVREMVQTIMDLLTELGVDVPDTWAALISRTGDLCTLGVTLADNLRGDQ